MFERPKTVGVFGRTANAILDYKFTSLKHHKEMIKKFRTGSCAVGK
jgi:hypothetical protein